MRRRAKLARNVRDPRATRRSSRALRTKKETSSCARGALRPARFSARVFLTLCLRFWANCEPLCIASLSKIQPGQATVAQIRLRA